MMRYANEKTKTMKFLTHEPEARDPLKIHSLLRFNAINTYHLQMNFLQMQMLVMHIAYT